MSSCRATIGLSCATPHRSRSSSQNWTARASPSRPMRSRRCCRRSGAMHLTQRRLRLGYVEQDEREDDHVVRALRKGPLRRVRDHRGGPTGARRSMPSARSAATIGAAGAAWASSGTKCPDAGSQVEYAAAAGGRVVARWLGATRRPTTAKNLSKQPGWPRRRGCQRRGSSVARCARSMARIALGGRSFRSAVSACRASPSTRACSRSVS
jgi:hypothetical protein